MQRYFKTDNQPLQEKWYIDSDGFMRVPVIIATAGILDYTYQDGNKEYRVREAKLPEEILSKYTVASAEGKPVTSEHPPDMLNSMNYKDYEKGVFMNPKIVGDSLHGELLIKDPELQQDIKDGIRTEVSCGFWSETEYKAGYYEGQRYDAVQRNIQINHIAVTTDGRAGQDVRIKLDSKNLPENIREKFNNLNSKEVKNMDKNAIKRDDLDKLLKENKDSSFEDIKKKIDAYFENKEKSEKTDKKDEDEKNTYQDPTKKDEDDPDDKEKKDEDDPDDKEKKDEDDPDDKEKKDENVDPDKMIEMLKKDNEMLKRKIGELDKKDSINVEWNEVRDTAKKLVTDSLLDEYNPDPNYYKRAVVDAAGGNAKLSGKELNGAYQMAKAMLQEQIRPKALQRMDSERLSYVDSLRKESEKNNAAFVGKRKVTAE